MTVKYQKFLKLAFVSLFFVFASCSESDNNTDDNQGRKLHSYDMEFINVSGSNTFQYAYSGSETSTIQAGNYDESIGNYGALTLNLTHGTNVISGSFILKENGSPLNLDYVAYQTLEGSLLEIRDLSSNRVFKAVSGIVTISSRNIEESSSTIRPANYKIEFDGEFELSDGVSTVSCIGTGAVAVGQPIP